MTKNELISDNANVLATAVELSSEIIKDIADNAIANTVDGKPLSDSFLKNAVSARLNAKLIPYMTGG